MLAAFQANELNKLGHASLDIGFRYAGNLHRERNILAHRARPQQVEVLKYHADLQTRLAQCFTFCGRNVLPVNGYAAAAWFFQTIQQADKRAFTCAAVTDDPVYLPLCYRQIDVINGRERHLSVVKNLRNIAENDHSYLLSVPLVAV